MKVNLAVSPLTLDGLPFVDEAGKPLLFSKMIGNALFQSQAKEAFLETYELAKKIYSSEGEIELGVSEVEKIKANISEKFIAGVVGQILEILADAKK
jgi:hypothetical protein